MPEEYRNIIEGICIRCNHVISPLDVLAWLENFERMDWLKALSVLNHFEFYSTNDTIRTFDVGLSDIVSHYRGKNIYVLPLGKIGKSGAAMTYYVKKTPTASKSSNHISIIDNNDLSSIGDGDVVVIADDFSGTGDSIVGFHNDMKARLPEHVIVCALTVIYMESAEANLMSHGIRVFGNRRKAAFAKRGSVFGYYPKMTVMRDFCFRYGNVLYPENKYKEGKSDMHPLGYRNTQSLVGFDHSIPNNTLPILWADSKVAGSDRRWTPLFPRRGRLLINRSKQFRESQYYWASTASFLGFGRDLFDWGERYSRESLQLLSVIYMKRRHRSPLAICQKLAIGMDEYDTIIENGMQKGLFNADGTLTELGITMLDAILKKSRFRDDGEIDNKAVNNDIIYVPKQFRGSP